MAEEKMTRQQQQIMPGKCPPEGCPPFDRIECIVVDKVYDSCFQIEDFSKEITTDEFTTGPLNVGDEILCGLDPDEPINCKVIKREPVDETGFVTLTLLVEVFLRFVNPNEETEVVERKQTIIKTVTLCCPDGVDPDCSESTLVACNCAVIEVDDHDNPTRVTFQCDIQVCLVIKCILKVQLLVPSYGFCVPAPCVTIPGVCPPTPPEQCF
ncbi:MAG: hypothetical protein PWP31_409 [Clostridia bacterium]|nr:hypothetical protein [Clostridia bacterium]